jgi:hypothetical protein
MMMQGDLKEGDDDGRRRMLTSVRVVCTEEWMTTLMMMPEAPRSGGTHVTSTNQERYKLQA